MLQRLIIPLSLLACVASLSCQSYTTTLTQSPGRVNEVATISTLHSIARAQIAYSVSNSGNYGTFEQLSEGGYLDSRFNSSKPVLYGYTLTITATRNSSDPGAYSYSCSADPKSAPNAKGRHFYIDSSSQEVHANATQPATVNDEIVQP
jgi:hypothetical protein